MGSSNEADQGNKIQSGADLEAKKATFHPEGKE
jgi:hypothetical protein